MTASPRFPLIGYSPERLEYWDNKTELKACGRPNSLFLLLCLVSAILSIPDHSEDRGWRA